jgi:hypothetical protein
LGEEADGDFTAKIFAALPGEEEGPVGRQEVADVGPDLPVADPCLYGPVEQEPAESQLRNDLERLADFRIPGRGEIPLSPPEVLHEFSGEPHLVYVNRSRQLDPAIAHVANLDRRVLEDLVLEAQVPLLHVWRLQIGIDGEKRRGGIQQDIVPRGSRHFELGLGNRLNAPLTDGSADAGQHDRLLQSVIAHDCIARGREVVVVHVRDRVARPDHR